MAGRTFSCWICFNSFSSRYVRLLRTGVLNGFMIFLMATDDPVSWSFAELLSHGLILSKMSWDYHLVEQTYQTRPNAPTPDNDQSRPSKQIAWSLLTHPNRLQVNIASGHLAIDISLASKQVQVWQDLVDLEWSSKYAKLDEGHLDWIGSYASFRG
jgi:hypothetical protein